MKLTPATTLRILFLGAFFLSSCAAGFKEKGGFLANNYKTPDIPKQDPIPASIEVGDLVSKPRRLGPLPRVALSIPPLLSLAGHAEMDNDFGGDSLQPLEAEILLAKQLVQSQVVRSASIGEGTSSDFLVLGSIDFRSDRWLHHSGLGALVQTVSLLPLLVLPQSTDKTSVAAHLELVRRSDGRSVLSKDYREEQTSSYWALQGNAQLRSFAEDLLPRVYARFASDLRALPAETWSKSPSGPETETVPAPIPATDSLHRISLAITDLQSHGTDPGAAAIATDRLGVALSSSNAFRLLERQQMGAILSEQGLQSSGACDSQDCTVKVGQLLGVEQILAGSIGYTNGLYSFSLRLIDVKTGEILRTATQDCSCSFQEVLTTAVPRLAAAISSQTGSGSAWIVSDPPGAQVLVDGSPKGATPASLEDLPPGSHALTLRKEHHQDWTGTVEVALGKPSRVQASLRPLGYLKVKTSPSAAMVSVADMAGKASPLGPLAVEPGQVPLSIRLQNHKDTSLNVLVKYAQTTAIRVDLSPTEAYRRQMAQDHRRNMWIARGILGAAALGSWGAGHYQQIQADDADKAYRSHTTPGDHTSEFRKVDDHQKLRNVFYGVAAGFVGATTLTFLF